MIYKYTKCESVIAKIMADADMSEKNIRITDMREWIFEAIEKIGAPLQYLDKESGVDEVPIFKLEDGQIPLPEDLHSLTAVAYSTTENGQWVPVRTNAAQFKGDPRTMHNHDHFMPKRVTATCQLYGENLTRFYEKHGHYLHDEDVTCFVKPGWLVLNRKNGYVKLAYKSIAVDERGYPLIPDTASYQEAVYWYVMMKLSFPKMLKGKLGGKVTYSYQTYAFLMQQWNFYRNQAYAEAMMPTETDMRSIRNEWNKLVPEWDDQDVFCSNVGRKQLNYNDYYYGY